MKCKSLIKQCRECGRDNSDRVEICPDCQADMHCDKDAVNGYTKCGNHGGPVPKRDFYGRGNMTTGTGSSFPITRLAAKYNQQMKNGQVLSNRAAIDTIDHRVKQLLERIDIDEAPDRVANLYKLWTEFKNLTPDTTDWIIARENLNKEFDKVYHDYAAWSQIFEALDLRGKMVEREVKVLKEIKAIMTAEDGYELAAKLMAAVMRIVGDDPKRLKQVQYEFGRIIGESSDLTTEGYVEDVGGGGQAE